MLNDKVKFIENIHMHTYMHGCVLCKTNCLKPESGNLSLIYFHYFQFQLAWEVFQIYNLGYFNSLLIYSNA